MVQEKQNTEKDKDTGSKKSVSDSIQERDATKFSKFFI